MNETQLHRGKQLEKQIYALEQTEKGFNDWDDKLDENKTSTRHSDDIPEHYNAMFTEHFDGSGASLDLRGTGVVEECVEAIKSIVDNKLTALRKEFKEL